MQHSPPGAQQYNGVVENTTQRCNKIAMASRRAAERRSGPGGGSCVRGLDARGDKLWAESAKDAAQKLNQAASPSKPGCASPQELFTGKKGAFLVVPLFQYGFTYRERRSKLDDKAVPCYFLNAGNNHADCSVKVLRTDTGRTCDSNNVTWAPLPQSGEGGVQYCPSRASTAYTAGGVIRDCLDAARRCRYPPCRHRLAAARHCRYAVCSSHLAATTAAAVVVAAVRALTQRSHLAAARTDWYAARHCRSAACALAQRPHPSLEAARHCRYATCSSHLAATTAAIVNTAVRALT